MLYISVMLLLIGVPVANTTPRPPVISSKYRHFANISLDFCASAVERPATLRILVYKKRFLYMSLSSTNIMSTPSCSNVTTSSLRCAARNLSKRVSRFRFVISNCFTVKCSPPLALISCIPSVISLICSFISHSWRS